MNNQCGVGLAELLIALLLASFTTITLMRHYLNTKQQYHHTQTSLEQSIELQLVTDMIRDSARRAGFTPCLGIEHLISLDRRGDQKNLVAIQVGKEGASSLHINRMSEHFSTVSKIVGSVELLTTNNQTMHRNQAILVADCYHAEIHTISRLSRMGSGKKITLTHPLAFVYHPPIYVGAWLEETYFIQSKDQDTQTLYYHRNHHSEELTTVVHGLSSRVEKHRGRTLLHVTLHLDNAHPLEIETMARTY